MKHYIAIKQDYENEGSREKDYDTLLSKTVDTKLYIMYDYGVK